MQLTTHFRRVPAACVLFCCLASVACAQQHAAAPAGKTADEALKLLEEGNKRFAEQPQRMSHRNQTTADRMGLLDGQNPFASVLSCSDSRVPPEVIFNQGLGNLFVVRVAGNVASDEAVASLEYAAGHLGSKLILVLGHESCGAVGAALDGTREGHLQSLTDRILPAIQKAAGADRAARLDSAVRINVQNVVEQLRKSHPILDEKLKDKTFRIVGGRYDLHTGLVTILYP